MRGLCAESRGGHPLLSSPREGPSLSLLVYHALRGYRAVPHSYLARLGISKQLSGPSPGGNGLTGNSSHGVNLGSH